jgi:poly(A)-specific ribonuclease
MSPLSAGGVDLKLERAFAFSSSACDFLKKNGFDFGKVFANGITYLSQEEEHDLREEFNKRADKNAKIPDVVIPADETATLEFYRSSRKTIAAWTKNPKVCCSHKVRHNLLTFPSQKWRSSTLVGMKEH